MSIQGTSRAQAKPWSRTAKDLIAGHGREATAKVLGISSGLLSALHNGSRRTSDDVIGRCIAWAASLEQPVTLTPADLGRPDLAKGAKR